MAGHSKWANIKFRKAKQDASRGKAFTKLIREITVAARMGGEDVQSNPRLRAAVDKALVANMKRDTINNAIKRGVGGGEESNLMECRYEGYGPSGVAVIVDCLTDNKNRTVADVRHAFSKAGGQLGTENSVAYLFVKQGQLMFGPGSNEDRIMEIAIEAGAEDVIANDDGSVDVITKPDYFEAVRDAILKQKINPEYAEITFSSTVTVNVDDPETAEKILNLIDVLEDLDDVQNVYSNAHINESVLDGLKRE